MQVQQRLYDIDDLWRLVQDANDDTRYELIEGEIIEMPPPGEEHGYLTIWLGMFLAQFVSENQLGRVTAESGYYSQKDRNTLLSPDIAFRRLLPDAEPASQRWVPLMPDLAVEIKSPSNTLAELRRKAAIYLNHGSQLVWIILPASRSAEVHRLNAPGEIHIDAIEPDGALCGEGVLPGFELPLAKLFA